MCAQCGYNADRDYAAALNIARLGMTYLLSMQIKGEALAFSMTDASVKPCRYMRQGAVLLFPPPVPADRLLHAEKIYLNGWKCSATLRSSYPTSAILRLCG